MAESKARRRERCGNIIKRDHTASSPPPPRGKKGGGGGGEEEGGEPAEAPRAPTERKLTAREVAAIEKSLAKAEDPNSVAIPPGYKVEVVEERVEVCALAARGRRGGARVLFVGTCAWGIRTHTSRMSI